MSASLVLHLLRRVHPQEREAVFQQAARLVGQLEAEKDIAKLDLKDDVLRRANGFYTYFAADIAYHRNKFEERGFDKVINIWP